MPLPTPVGKQLEVLYLPATGHVAVLGTAGSGKTTLAILRAVHLADAQTAHGGSTLLVTFNKALVAYLKYLHGDSVPGVTVENYHQFARGYLSSRGKLRPRAICPDDEARLRLITNAMSVVQHAQGRVPPLERKPEFFLDEIKWIEQHGLKSDREYRKAERVGRAESRVVKDQRALMYQVFEEYRRLRKKSAWDFDWDDLATAVYGELVADTGPRLYRHIVIDEGQDFSPEMIRSLVRAVPNDGSVTFFGDVAQQIYGHRMTWRSAELNIRTPWYFTQNYRNTREIARLGLAICRMPYYAGLPDIVEPVAPRAEGPPPALVRCESADEEISFVAQLARTASTRQSVAVLVRDRKDERRIAAKLPNTSIKLHRGMPRWVDGPSVQHGTYHSAKGLEFDMVIMPFCSSTRLPDPASTEALGVEDAQIQDGRLIYVGVTRARTNLVITYTGSATALLPMDRSLYLEQEAGQL